MFFFLKEIQKLKGGKKPSLNEQKNDHLTVQWLSTAISELRSELAEVSSNYNTSAEMQQRQELASGLDLLRGDVASFRRDLEELRAEQQQTVVTLGQLKQDVETSIKNSQIASSANAEIKTKFITYAKV
ncbi:conserved hypothetical protein [Pediculus humanus corporis]|uniref:Uncharacterized protein n=1 Tax=Pediculus humanus subsp. corporis TaxID=121224 RepID=E0VXI6_PEDHC|nr:uncharacterized protein Phum_PHUM500980 [Pediculus humanus corporis]EEB18092.1 conserved hypothetical protein [Pediculus humanus corporis]